MANLVLGYSLALMKMAREGVAEAIAEVLSKEGWMAVLMMVVSACFDGEREGFLKRNRLGSKLYLI